MIMFLTKTGEAQRESLCLLGQSRDPSPQLIYYLHQTSGVPITKLTAFFKGLTAVTNNSIAFTHV